MKKFLLATSALTAFAASAAFAEGPTVTIGGTIDAQVGVASQESQFKSSSSTATDASDARLRDNEGTHIRTDSRVEVKVSGKADNGLGYGGVVSLVGDASGQADDGSTDQTDKAYVFVESGLGKVEAGSNNGASDTMKVGAASLARGSGGIAGDFYKFVNLGATVTTATGPDGGILRKKFIVTPDLPSVALPGARHNDFSAAADTSQAPTDNANKITYYSPRISGVQLGVSYAPNLSEAGNATSFKGKYAATGEQYARDVWGAGLNYQGSYNQVGIKASAVAESSGKAQKASSTADSNDAIRAYELGTVLDYAGFSLGGSWATIPEFGRAKSQDDSAGFWTLGAGYEFGPFATSVTYLSSKAEDDSASTTRKNEFSNISVGADYKLAPGLVPYVEVSFFDTDDKVATTTDNSGSVVLLGTQLTF